METSNNILFEKSKTGIMTFHLAHNYGALLQAYALRTFLRNNGIFAEIVPYETETMHINADTRPHLRRSIKDNLSLIKNQNRIKEQAKPFEEFQKRYLNVFQEHCSKEAISRYDKIVIGSDQVWNRSIVGNDLVYWGDFKKAGQKIISYAASFGASEIDDEYRKIIKDHCNNFNSISVREQSAKEILFSCGVESEMVCDPVFLLSRCEWEEIIKDVGQDVLKKHSIAKPYVLAYILQRNENLIDIVDVYRKMHGMEVIVIHPTGDELGINGRMIRNVSPLEFVYFIKNANAIATNSFHALSFSILFNRPVLYKAHKQLGTRTENLLQLVGVNGDGFINNYTFDNLEKLITRSKEFLLSAIG